LELNEVTGAVIGAAMKVHSALGPGLLESAYHACLLHELTQRGMSVRSELPLPVRYDGLEIDAGYRVDLLVDEQVVVELKAVDALLPIHRAQLLTYLKLSGKRLGLLLNFNVEHLRDGVKRLING
jgi:GxxExxY protein